MRQPKPKPGIGWPLLPRPEDGSMQWPGIAESVDQGIRVILLTKPGEQLMAPHFGGGLERFLHEQNSPTCRRQIREVVMRSLTRWEPRIILDGVEVNEVPDEPNHIRIDIFYRLRRTGEAHRKGLTIETGG